MFHSNFGIWKTQGDITFLEKCLNQKILSIPIQNKKSMIIFIHSNVCKGINFQFYLLECKNAGHNMAIVGEPCNADAHAKITALFMSMLCPRLCVHMYCTHCVFFVFVVVVVVVSVVVLLFRV